MTTRSRLILAVHGVLLRTARGPLRRVWGLAYRLVARAWAAYLAYGERDSSAYVRGSLGAGDALPGLSDVDVAVVLAEDSAGPGLARERATGRWMRPRRAVPVTDLLLDYPLIFEDGDLREVAGSSTLTHGLGRGEQPAVYFGEGVSQDKIRMLERPGLYAAAADWRRLWGRERRPREHARDAQLRRIAAWLELVYWWQWVFPACADPTGPRTASLCVKLVSEPARIWLWLAHGERAAGRADALRRAQRRLPQEEEGLRLALDLERSLTKSPDPPLAELLPVLVRLSRRIAELVTEEIFEHGTTEVRLAGLDPVELVLPHGSLRPGLLPLCDSRSLAVPRLPDECFAPSSGDPGDPAVLGAATAADTPGPYAALRAGGLMIFPARRWRTALRAVKCSVTDPVSFALADGHTAAAFPNVRGWSAQDVARRGVAEHRAWLGAAPAPVGGIEPEELDGGVLAMLLSAARAALFLESVTDGAPQLPVTVTETVRQLAARSGGAAAVAEDGLGCYREFAVYRKPPPPETLAAVRALVDELPAYAGDRPRAAVR